jgi:hypothetical protein
MLVAHRSAFRAGFALICGAQGLTHPGMRELDEKGSACWYSWYC